METELLSPMTQDPFTHLIIGKAMETHSALGPGLVEEFYQRDLVARLSAAGIEHQSKPRHALMYRGFVADTFEPDLIFPGKLVPELKALRGEFAPSHFTQLLAYQKCWAIRTGMLLDFGKASLVQKRVVYDQVHADFPITPVPPGLAHADLAARLVGLIRQTYLDIGLGYREATWQGLVGAAMQADGVPHIVSPSANIAHLGPANLRCILVDQRCALSITALGDGVSAADRAILHSCLGWLDLPWGIAAHFGRRCVEVRIIQKKNHR